MDGSSEITFFYSIISISIVFPFKSLCQYLSDFGGAWELQTTAPVLPADHSTGSRETRTEIEGAIEDNKARHEGGRICWFAFSGS